MKCRSWQCWATLLTLLAVCLWLGYAGGGNRRLLPAVSSPAAPLRSGSATAAAAAGGADLSLPNRDMAVHPGDIDLAEAQDPIRGPEIRALLGRLRDWLTRADGDSVRARENPHAIMKKIIAEGADAVPELIAILTDASQPAQFRRYVALMLDKIHDPSSIPALLQVASEVGLDEGLRVAAVLALARFKDESVGVTLAQIAEREGSGLVAKACLGSLSGFQTDASIQALSAAAQSDHYETRRSAMISLGELAAGDAGYASEAAAVEVQDAGLLMLEELSELDARREVDPLAQLGADQVEWMNSTLLALDRLGASGPGLAIACAACNSGADDRLRCRAVANLGKYKNDADAEEFLTQVLEDPSPQVRMIAARSLLAVSGGTASNILSQAIERETNAMVRADLIWAVRHE